MKKIIKYGIILFVLGTIGCLSYNIAQKAKYKKEVAARIQKIPDFSFQTLTGNKFRKQDLNPSQNTVFVYFNSECEHCQNEAEQIGKNLPEFKNSQLVFISYESPELIEKFARQYNIKDQPQVTFLHDAQGVFADLFDANSIPYILIYNSRGELLQKYKGEVKIEAITKLLK